MNLQWLASAGWALVVKALLHTLWQGAIIAGLLVIALRRVDRPTARYQASLGALAGLILAGIVTWAWLNLPVPKNNPLASPPTVEVIAAPVLEKNEAQPIIVQTTPPAPKRIDLRWTAWMAFIWLVGAGLMLGRAGLQVAGAERLRRSTRPLADKQISELLEDARNAVGLARRVRMAVTDKLTSPAVVGVLVPTLILPLSLTTTLTPEQIRFILLHELAHIRRGDYFANLFQLFAEALLFFNPAVWWISRQMRIEREACCDALAIELSGAPADYARTLVHVAENVLQPAPVAAPAFGDEREPSSLADRVQRLLVPGYRPRLRLTWRAMLASLCVGGALLVLSAIGTRVTVAAILSPQQRIERIEKRMTELGEKPGVVTDQDSSERVTVIAHVRTVDGTPLHKERSITVHAKRRHSSGYYGGWISKEGWATNKVQPGEIWVEANVKGYAPAIVGPFDGKTTNFVDAGEIVLDKGFDIQLHVTDANTGAAITNANLQPWLHHIPTGDSLQNQRNLKTGADGKATMTFCIPQNLSVTVNAPGYEITQTTFEKLTAGQTLELKLHSGVVVTGRVTEKPTGKPIAGANLQIIYHWEGDSGWHHDWGDKLFQLATTDADGRYVINQFATGVKYVLGVSAAGYESVLLKPFTALAPRELSVELGPELIVRGQVSGVVTQLQVINKEFCLSRNFSEEFEHNSYGHQAWVPLILTNGICYYVFTNRTAGKVTLSGLGVREERVITTPVENWNLVVTEWREREPANPPKREVVFRFKHSSGVSPRGTVRVRIPSDEDPQRSAVSQIMAITNGEVRVKIPFGYSTDIEPERMVGYMFNRTGEWRSPTGEQGDWMNIQVGSNTAPLVIDIPLLPAGAIYARAKNTDGTPAGGLFFGVNELKKAPGRDQNGLGGGDSMSGNTPRQWVSGALPLGGTYQVNGWRGNSFCISKPVKLTEANPDAEVEMQFAPGKTFNGVVLGPDGHPLREVEMKANFSLADNHGFGLKNIFADERGHFQIDDTTPDLGTYSVDFSAPGLQATTVKLDYNIQPQVIRLKRGRTLGGRVIDSASGQPIPGMEVRAYDYESKGLPQQETQTDDNGYFTFTTLGDGNYSFAPNDAQLIERSNPRFPADGRTNIVLRVKLYEWSKVKPKIGSSDGSLVQPIASAAIKTSITTSRPASDSQTNAPMVLITGEIYRMRQGDFEKIVADPAYVGTRQDKVEQFQQFKRLLTSSGLQPIQRPRIQTTSGTPAWFYVGDQTNSFEFACQPVVTNGMIDLSSRITLISTAGTVTTTNEVPGQISLDDGGGHVFSIKTTSDVNGKDTIVVMIGAEIVRNLALSNSSQPKQPESIQKPEGDGTNGARKSLTQTFKLDGSLREDKLKQALVNAGVKIPPTVFLYSEGGILLVRGSDEQLALVHRALMKLDGASDQELEIAGKSFTRRLNQIVETNLADPNLLTRSYKMDPHNFEIALKKSPGEITSTNGHIAVRAFFKSMGVDLESSPGKTAFYSDKSGILLVRATAADLDVLDRVVETINYTPPQIHIKARFIEITQSKTGGNDSYQWYPGDFKLNETNGTATHPANGALVNGILSDANLQVTLQATVARDGSKLLGEPEVVTTSGRQCKIMVGETLTILTNFLAVENRTNHVTSITYQASQMQTGVALDVVPQVLADGCAIKLALKPSWREFLGYAPTNSHPFQTSTGEKVIVPGIHPIVRTQEVATTLTVWDGQTAVLGGIISERLVKKSMPVVGKVPLLGKLFEKQETVKVNNFVFVTATIVDPAGNRVHTDAEMATLAQTGVPPQPK